MTFKIKQTTKQTTIVVIGSLRVKSGGGLASDPQKRHDFKSIATYIPNCVCYHNILWANLADDKLILFFLSVQKIDFDISKKKIPKETICMKCQTLFSGKLSKLI